MNPSLNSDQLLTNHGKDTFTAKEIAQQPKTWQRVWEKIQNEADRLLPFLQKLQKKSDLNIVLTGAGSSAFIGDAVSGSWLKGLSQPAQAIPTTDLVTHFEERILTSDPLLLISFARSGNSPESAAVVERANQFCEEVYHLVISCNPDGKLAQMANKREGSYVFLLPPEAEDQSLAMTNSFTSMALAATLIPTLVTKEANIESQLDILSTYGQKIIDDYNSTCHKVAQLNFNRIIFLGSGPLFGIAKESHLKVQELTNGKVIGKFDSFLGFRHGPKAVLDDNTLLVYLVSNDASVRQYERDLMTQINNHKLGVTTLAVSESSLEDIETDYAITLANEDKLDKNLWPITCTLPAQIMGFYKSLALSYNPDNPSPNGTIARVVEGVKIYNN